MKRTFCWVVVAAALWCSRAEAQLYVSASRRIYEYDLSGQFMTVTTSTENVIRQGLAIGPDGLLYGAVSNGSDRVDRFALNLSSSATFVTSGQGGVFTPLGIAFGPDGNLYVASTNSSRIERYFGPLAGTPGANNPSPGNPGTAHWSPTISSPVDLEFAPDGTLYGTATQGSGSILRFDSSGAFTVVATEVSSSPGGLAINAAGDTLFARDSTGTVFKYAINPDHSLTFDNTFSLSYGPGSLGNFSGLSFGPDGFLYASTRTNNGNLNPNINTDYVVRINPSTGAAVGFVRGGINTMDGVNQFGDNPTFLTFAPTPVPEPSTWALLGMAGVFGWRAMLKVRRLRREAD